MTAPIQHRPLRILTDDLRDRLGDAIACIHALRDLGIQVVAQDLRQGQPRALPQLHVTGAAGMQTLRDRIKSFMRRGDRCSGVLCGCEVCWQQPKNEVQI